MRDEKEGTLGKINIFWLKIYDFFWHQKISLFLPLKYLDFCLTFIVLIIFPFLVMFTVFFSGSVSFILNGKLFFFYHTLGWRATQVSGSWQVIFLLLPWFLPYFYCRCCHLLSSLSSSWIKSEIVDSKSRTLSVTSLMLLSFVKNASSSLLISSNNMGWFFVSDPKNLKNNLSVGSYNSSFILLVDMFRAFFYSLFAGKI